MLKLNEGDFIATLHSYRLKYVRITPRKTGFAVKSHLFIGVQLHEYSQYVT